ncbi:MAG: phosphatidylglycerophosphatase A family protein [Methylosarcina sp.]
MSIFHNTPLGKNQVTPKQIMTDPVLLLAFGFGSGLAKKAPGTMGTVAAIPIYLGFAQADMLVYSVLTMAAILIGIPICGKAAEKLGVHDYNGIVWDEVAGYLITMWLAPATWQTVIVGFILFRIFDILKPWPIRWVDQRISGGLGIMLDDVLAAVFADALLVFFVQQGWIH